MSCVSAGPTLIRSGVLLLSLAVWSGAHSIWIESAPEGLRACFGEAEEGERDTLKPTQNFDKLEVWSADGSAIPPVVKADHVALGSPAGGVLAIHRSMPVHGKGKDAGRAVFLARHASGSGLGWKISTEPLDIVPSVEGKGEALVLRDGKPSAGQKVSLLGPDGKGAEAVADARGKVVLPAVPGRWLVSGWIEVAGKGSHLGKAYAKTWHVATLAWERP